MKECVTISPVRMCLIHIFHRSESGSQPLTLFFFIVASDKSFDKTNKKIFSGGDSMLPWWVLIPAFIAGAILGFIITAVCVYDSVTHPGRKWWEE